MKKILVTESVLKSLITRALNEALDEFLPDEIGIDDSNIPNNEWGIIQKWALGVRNGMPYNDERIYGPFVGVFYNNSNLRYTVLKAFGYENTNMTTIEGDEDLTDGNGEVILDKDGNPKKARIDNPDKPSLDTYKMCSGNADMTQDVIIDFFSDVSNLSNNEKSDAFPGHTESYVNKDGKVVPGYNLKEFVNTALYKSPKIFLLKLCNLLGFYARHYFRKHYDENVLQYSNNSKSINSNTPKQIGYDDDDYNADAVSDSVPTDALGNTGDTQDEFRKQTGNSYYSKMLKLVEKMVADEKNNLAPQERKILQCVVDVAKTGVSQERLNKMDDLSDTQKRQVVYDEVAERLGMPIESVKRSISSAIKKASQTKQAKMLQEQKKMKEHLVNEVMKRILNKLFK